MDRLAAAAPGPASASSTTAEDGWGEEVGVVGRGGGRRQVSELYSKTSNSEFVNMATVAKYQFRQCTNTAETSGM